MSKKLSTVLSNFVESESGQGITEYGAILAFVSVLVVVVAGFVNSGLKTALSQSFSLVTSSLNALNTAAT
jgi:Flp pilus assembly pilin Flp